MKRKNVILSAVLAAIAVCVGAGFVLLKEKSFPDSEEQSSSADSKYQKDVLGEPFDIRTIGIQQGDFSDAKYIISEEESAYPDAAVILMPDTDSDYGTITWDNTSLDFSCYNEQYGRAQKKYIYVTLPANAGLEIAAAYADDDYFGGLYKSVKVGRDKEIAVDNVVWNYKKITYCSEDFKTYYTDFILITGRGDGLSFQVTLRYSDDTKEILNYDDEQLITAEITNVSFVEKNYEEIEACSPEGARNICDSDGAVSLTVDKNVIEGESSWQLWYEDSVSVSVEQDGISGEYDFGFEAYPSAEYEELVSDFTFLQDTYENVNAREKITLDVKGFTVNCIPVTYNTDYGIQAEYSMWTDVEGVVVSCGFSWYGREGESSPQAEKIMQTAFLMLTVEEVDRDALDSRGAGAYDLETMESMIDQCYKGQDQEGADVYYAVNTDGDYAGYISYLHNFRRMEFLSVIGSASNKGDDVTITDEKSGDQETVTVIYQNDGAVTVIASDGIEAQLQRCDKEDFVDLVSEMEETVDSLYNLF